MSAMQGHPNKVYQDAINNFEMARQISVIAAGGNSAAVRSAEITFYRACVASALANGVQSGVFRQALIELGTGGI